MRTLTFDIRMLKKASDELVWTVLARTRDTHGMAWSQERAGRPRFKTKRSGQVTETLSTEQKRSF